MNMFCRFSLYISLIALFGCLTTPSDGVVGLSDPDAVLPSGEAVVLVHGLSCPLCANNLDGQLMRLSGVESARIDLDTGEVTVALAPGHEVTGAQLAEAVHQAGFTFRGLMPKGSGQ